MVSILAFYSDNPSSNPAEVDSYSVKVLFDKINKKEARVGPLYKITIQIKMMRIF